MNKLFKFCLGFTGNERVIHGQFESFIRLLTRVGKIICIPGIPGNLCGHRCPSTTPPQIGICTSGQILVLMGYCQEYRLLFILNDPSFPFTLLLQRSKMFFKTLALKMASGKYSEGVYIRNRKDL